MFYVLFTNFFLLESYSLALVCVYFKGLFCCLIYSTILKVVIDETANCEFPSEIRRQFLKAGKLFRVWKMWNFAVEKSPDSTQFELLLLYLECRKPGKPATSVISKVKKQMKQVRRRQQKQFFLSISTSIFRLFLCFSKTHTHTQE